MQKPMPCSVSSVNRFRNFLHNFLLCGLTGWCTEIICTSLASLRRRNLRLTGTTSLWMFPIYGSAALLHPLFQFLKHRALWLRGLTYMSLIFSMEFLSGTFLKRHEICPWDYSRSRYNIGKVIRLDYAPAWFTLGLLLEHMLTHKPSATDSYGTKP